jgi:hypothetical protein
MRKVLHRILSAAPITAAAYLTIWATAFPVRAAERYTSFRHLLMSDARFFWLCVAVITGYAVLWWLSSLEPKSRRQKLQKGLRPYFKQMSAFSAELKNAETDAEFLAKTEEINAALGPCCQWIMDNMGDVAFEKFNNAPIDSLIWTWPSNPNSEIRDKHNNGINFMNSRVETLELFLRSDAWDGVPTGRWALIKRRYKRMKDDPNSRFNRLLRAMLGGPAPSSSRKNEASGSASDEEPPAYCGDTQTPQDTSEDASG